LLTGSCNKSVNQTKIVTIIDARNLCAWNTGILYRTGVWGAAHYRGNKVQFGYSRM
jgi:hypothetical protein